MIGASASITNYWREGDVLQLASVQDINLLSHQSTTRNKDYVVTSNVDTTAGGLATVPISPVDLRCWEKVSDITFQIFNYQLSIIN